MQKCLTTRVLTIHTTSCHVATDPPIAFQNQESFVERAWNYIGRRSYNSLHVHFRSDVCASRLPGQYAIRRCLCTYALPIPTSMDGRCTFTLQVPVFFLGYCFAVLKEWCTFCADLNMCGIHQCSTLGWDWATSQASGLACWLPGHRNPYVWNLPDSRWKLNSTSFCVVWTCLDMYIINMCVCVAEIAWASRLRSQPHPAGRVWICEVARLHWAWSN